MRPLRQNAPVKPSLGHVRFGRSFDFTRLRWQKGDNGGSRVVSWTRDVERSVGGAQRRASTFPSDSLRPRSAGDLVVDLNLPDLRLWGGHIPWGLSPPPPPGEGADPPPGSHHDAHQKTVRGFPPPGEAH